MYLLLPGRHVGARVGGHQTWRLHTKLFKFGWNTFPNNARMNHHTDLNLGKVVYISIIFRIPLLLEFVWTVMIFFFWWRDRANQPLHSAVHGSWALMHLYRPAQPLVHNLFHSWTHISIPLTALWSLGSCHPQGRPHIIIDFYPAPIHSDTEMEKTALTNYPSSSQPGTGKTP